MKYLWHNKQKQNLILYFAGWGTPVSAINHLILPKGYDLLICYDYQDLRLDFEFSLYQEIRVVAWSMGVWVAERVLSGIPLQSATAINGTGKPYDEQCGIPPDIFDATLNNFTEQNRLKFERRMCGKMLTNYQQLGEQRSFSDLHLELTALFYAIKQDECTDLLSWTHAIIAEQDKIFSAQHQQAYWQSRCPISFIAGEHYCLPYFSRWEQLWT
ncbi:pimeloyl-ACP methyl esterase BioG family protein [Rodentibacter caecimuris]|uniref:Dithiobiotin synthetase n=1 Tax=Rodentibacter caecimuris TaxID=1796644 RepID=A0ABX3L195_9PAST|nr:hypothetical protein BKG89_00060 [Rodentibacter heylii]